MNTITPSKPTTTTTTTTTTTNTTTTTTSTTTNKYDRQLRLWGTKGQYNVSHTCIVLINPTTVGTETMKNCILPGIQHIHIIDYDYYDYCNDSHNDSIDNNSSMIDEDTNTNNTNTNTNTDSNNSSKSQMNHHYYKEYSSNFFLSKTELHHGDNNNNNDSTTSTTTTTVKRSSNRAEMALQYLLELNPDVTGSYTQLSYNTGGSNTTTNTTNTTGNTNTNNSNDDYNTIISTKLIELQKVHEQIIVIGSDLDIETIQSITSITKDMSIPFLTVNSYGFIGILQIQFLPLYPIINPIGTTSTSTTNNNTATSTNNVPDLRIHQPFPLLQQFMETFIETHFTLNENDTNDNNTNTNNNITPSGLLSTHEYSNIPYPIILYYIYHFIWKVKYPILKPISFQQKLEFQLLIQQHYYNTTTSSSSTTGNTTNTNTTAINRNDLPINVLEAIQNSYLAYTERTIDINHIQSIIDKIQQYNNNYSSDNNHQNQRTTKNNKIAIECEKLYIVLQALQLFIQRNNNNNNNNNTNNNTLLPPLHGSIPDMTASTNLYIELQSIYKQQANMDIQQFNTYIDEIMMTNTQNNNNNIIHIIQRSDIDNEYIRTFCQNIHNIDIILLDTPWLPSTLSSSVSNDDTIDNTTASSPTTTSLLLTPKSIDICNELGCNVLDEFMDEINDDHSIPLLWYFVYEACQLFYINENYRYPGTIIMTSDDHTNTLSIEDEQKLCHQDAIVLQSYIEQIMKIKYHTLYTHPVIQRTILSSHTTNDDTNEQPSSFPSKYAIEMTRYGNSEIHTIASIIGGITAQEIIKLITYQYTPIQNTFIYNGITSTGAVYMI